MQIQNWKSVSYSVQPWIWIGHTPQEVELKWQEEDFIGLQINTAFREMPDLQNIY